MKTKTKTSSNTPLARAYLRAISLRLKQPAAFAGRRINDLLTDIYSAAAESSQWDTFAGWKRRGFKVAKGERGFVVWTKPHKLDRAGEETPDGNTTPDGEETPDGGTTADGEETPGREMFFVSYIFCARQVYDDTGLTPDGEEYKPSGLLPPHLTQTTQPEPAKETPKPTPQPAPALEEPKPAQPAQATPAAAIDYIPQIAI